MENLERIEKAKKIGKQEALTAVCIALTIDLGFIIWSYIDDDYLWLLDNGFYWKFPLAAGIMLLAGTFFGKRFAKSIIIKNSYWAFHGIICAWITLAVTVFLTGIISFPIDFLQGRADWDEFLTYAITPTLLVMIYSFIPVGIHGFWFGYRIHKKGRKMGLYEEAEKP